MPCGSFSKSPDEAFPVVINMRGRLPTGRTITRATLAAVDLGDNSTATTTVLARASATITDSYLAEASVKAGTAGHRYEILFDLFDTGNSHYCQSLVMLVRAE